MTDETTPTHENAPEPAPVAPDAPVPASPVFEPTALGSVYVTSEAPGAAPASGSVPAQPVPPAARTVAIRRWHVHFAAGVAAVLIFLAGTWFGSALARHAAFDRTGGFYGMRGGYAAQAPGSNGGYGGNGRFDGNDGGFGRGGRHSGWGSNDSSVTARSAPGAAN